MKTILAFICFGFLICVSCNIKKPLKDVLTEANQNPAACLILKSRMDTILVSHFFPMLQKVDSLSGRGLSFQILENRWNAFGVEIKDTTRFLYDVSVFQDGKHITLMVLYQDSVSLLPDDQAYITFKGMLNRRLLFEYDRQPAEFYAMWQNVILPSRFIKFGKNNVFIQIPKESGQVRESFIRIFGTDGKRKVLDLRVPILYGMPLPDAATTK